MRGLALELGLHSMTSEGEMIGIGKRYIAVVAVFVIVVILSLSGGASAQAVSAGLLVDPSWLLERMEAPGLRIVDLRGGSAYDRGHIPGAVRVDRSAYNERREGVPNMIPSVPVLAKNLGQLGLSAADTIVAYDTGHGLAASRFYVAMSRMGHERIRILDGGFKRWVSEGHPVGQEPALLAPTEYRPAAEVDNVVDKEWVSQHLFDPNVIFLDTRTPEEYSGGVAKAARGGHIPGAVNLNWVENMAGGDVMRFKTPEELERLYEESGITKDKEVVTYCQSGNRASHTYFVLSMLGYNVKMYDGSWVEWGNDQRVPVER